MSKPTPQRKFSAAMVRACRETIAAYDELIRTGNITGWNRYGGACRLCIADPMSHCETCVLDDGAMGCMTKTRRNLVDAFRSHNKKAIIGAAKRRRKFIVDRVRAAGIEI